MIKQKDTELIQESLNGNAKAQEKLYDKYIKVVTDYIGKKYSSYRDVEDDISEIMIKIFTRLHFFDSQKSKFKSWVITVARNHMVDKWRCNTITLTSGNSNTYSLTSDQTNFAYNNSVSTDCELSGAVNVGSFVTYCTTDYENCNSVSYISTQLTPQDYMFLDMKYVQGYNYEEIGKEFNVTSSTVSNRVNYIKTKLKNNNKEIVYDD